MLKIAIITFALGGWASTAMLAASDATALDVGEKNLTLNQVMIALMSTIGVLIATIGWGLRSWSHQLNDQMGRLDTAMIGNTTEIAKLATVLQERDGQAEQINKLFELIGDLRAELASVKAKIE
jgi:Ca2+/H+ antiporter